MYQIGPQIIQNSEHKSNSGSIKEIKINVKPGAVRVKNKK